MIQRLEAEIKERDRKADQSIEGVMRPSMSLLCKLGSIVVHADEGLSNDGHPFDLTALRGLLGDPEVVAWLKGMQAAAFLPVKRK